MRIQTIAPLHPFAPARPVSPAVVMPQGGPQTTNSTNGDVCAIQEREMAERGIFGTQSLQPFSQTSDRHP